MADVGFASNLKSGPSRVRNPTVLFSLTFRQQRIANSSRKWNVHGSVSVHMPDLRFPESKFLPSEPMRVNRDVRPRRNFLLESG